MGSAVELWEEGQLYGAREEKRNESVCARVWERDLGAVCYVWVRLFFVCLGHQVQPHSRQTRGPIALTIPTGSFARGFLSLSPPLPLSPLSPLCPSRPLHLSPALSAPLPLRPSRPLALSLSHTQPPFLPSFLPSLSLSFRIPRPPSPLRSNCRLAFFSLALRRLGGESRFSAAAPSSGATSTGLPPRLRGRAAGPECSPPPARSPAPSSSTGAPQRSSARR